MATQACKKCGEVKDLDTGFYRNDRMANGHETVCRACRGKTAPLIPDYPNAARVPIDRIRDDGGTQSRAALDGTTLGDYRDALSAGANFPPCVVFYDGAIYWMADGFHRLAAYRAEGRKELPCDVRQGTRRDAILHSVGANEEHGLRRTNADKRRAVGLLLNDPEWRAKGNPWIARMCHVSEGLVREMEPIFAQNEDRTTREVQRGGKTYSMNTAKIGRKPGFTRQPIREEQPPDEDPVFALQPGARGVMNAVPRAPAPAAARTDRPAWAAKVDAVRAQIASRLHDMPAAQAANIRAHIEERLIALCRELGAAEEDVILAIQGACEE
jgi:hypothetical protein